MRVRTLLPAAMVLAASVAPAVGTTASPDATDTRLLSQPAISATHVAFVYASDLWSARLDGSEVRRLTTHSGVEARPVFSPDGTWLAFSAQYDGNTDVFVVPASGGEPRRLTWHPGTDAVRGFTPDGGAVLFASQRGVHTNRHWQLFTIGLDAGMPVRLPIPYGWKADLSADGSRIAYTLLPERMNQWKNYRGGTVSRIWIQDLADHSIEEVPQPDSGSNDTDPMWVGSELYFRSDRDGEFNLYAYGGPSRGVVRRTAHEDFPILNAGAGAGRIVYEQAGWLHVFDPTASASVGDRLRVGVPSDLIERRTRWVSGARYVRSADISPSGSRAVMEFRGEIVTVPAEKGNARNLTQSAGAHDRAPAWSPDGRWIAWFSDDGGEYQLHLIDQLGKDEPRVLPVEGAGFYEDIRWSPDSSTIAYSDNSWSLYLLDVDSGGITQIATEPFYGPFKTIAGNWSPDSRWLTYTQATEADFRRVWVYSLDEGRSYPVTDGLSDAYSPVFDESGDYLYFLSSTDAGPVRQWFAMSNADMDSTNNVYVAVLRRGVDSPFKAESDEEEVATEEEEGNADGTSDTGDPEAGPDPDATRIDFDSLDQRIVATPLSPTGYSDLQAGAAGQLYYLVRETISGFGAFGPGSLRKYDMAQRSETTLAEGVLGYRLSADGSKVLCALQGGNWIIASAASAINTGEGRLALDRLQVKIDPVAEWRQIYREAWRINRDYFYDPGFHGSDWEAMGEKYSEFLDHLATRGDLNRVLQWMASELAVGHHGVFGGDTLVDADTVPGGLLGADFEIDTGRYRFAKVYGGLNWTPDLRAPLTEPGVDVVAGEYLLAVNGEDLAAPENVYSRFENSAEQIVEITVGPSSDYDGSRTVQVVPGAQ